MLALVIPYTGEPKGEMTLVLAVLVHTSMQIFSPPLLTLWVAVKSIATPKVPTCMSIV